MLHQRATSPAPEAGDLVDAYRPAASFLASPRGAMLGQGELAVADRLDEVPDLLREATGDARPVAMGAVPFDDAAPAHLVVPARVCRSAPLGTAAAGQRRSGPRPLPGPWTMRPVPGPEAHVENVRRALKLVGTTVRTAGGVGPAAEDELRNVVLSRSLRLAGPAPVDVGQLLRNLAWRDPAGFTFAMPLPPPPATEARRAWVASDPPASVRTLIGASPELLVAKHGSVATANPLAGSAPRSADATTDQRRAVALLESDKDRREHAVVVEAVTEGLRPFCRGLDVPAEPELLRTATMWHLSTRVTGELRDPETPSALLARALHPTPAVCGTPTPTAREAIARLEPFDRGYYTGIVGHTDATGDGEWVITIRCAEIADDAGTVDLFAGGGIVTGSDPDTELAETSAKLRTLLLALGVNETSRDL